MGYESEIGFGGEIKKGKEKELEQAIEGLVGNSKYTDFDFPSYFFDISHNTTLEDWDKPFEIKFDKTEQKYFLVLEYSDGKLYQSEEFVRFIAPFMAPQDIDFRGEDGAYWGYRIRTDGTIMLLTTVVVEMGLMTKKEG